MDDILYYIDFISLIWAIVQKRISGKKRNTIVCLKSYRFFEVSPIFPAAMGVSLELDLCYLQIFF